MAPPIPYIEEVPGSPIIFLFLNLFTFFLHIIAMNLLLGLSLIVLFDKKAKGYFTQEKKFLPLPIIFAFTINLGIAPLLFLQVLYGHLFYTSSILMASYWIMLIPILIMSYYCVYILTKSTKYYLNPMIVGIVSILLLWVAFMFSNNMAIMIQPSKFLKYFENSKGTVLNLSDPMLWPRYIHLLVGAIAVSYLFLALIVHLKHDNTYLKAHFLRLFSNFTFIQIPIGLWFLLSIEKEAFSTFVSNFYYVFLLLLGAFSGVISAVFGRKSKLNLTIISLLITIVLMIITRHNLRTIHLKPYFSIDKLVSSPQTFNLILFILILLVGLGIVAWLLKISFKTSKITS